MTREMHMGDIVRHFKRETVENPTTEYLYKILAFASTRKQAKSWWFIRRCMLRSKFAPDRTPCL